ncbi:hypothetical protein A2662_03065 [Candidatus Giovannonibacteria bacterium RIFCSPHIGHO2_01_FULL_45_33]|uniref:Uncharacterized protein n=1 Tax=Candidatus Giovannonibacteria bacterium RIFCSPLOWO2_01_FULL_45_34 TaxID=1798351 RepID=A0A1F5X1T0_9BACT|nr:MAG: hypothetical protein A2662_03065 [Candidatus Giovannonibacteria bacterium RIFCSPHIGHO2_01_FULL_45_33]OGF68954.1 MAG: hypothetical protein A3C73_02435 [Candidatus Giovannonibacteria bacterium RIFCSPHIGHO2_02_FULL_44_11]OGF81855.1 MAG: hypothetical protein A2930_01935 [Candidatus Giovannonibacteria bacterium RIFCSPLOWO2_01_FULL_45_34]
MQEKPEVEVLNVMRGGARIFLREGNSLAERRKLAESIEKMIRNGHSVFLLKEGTKSDSIEKEASCRIKGYDAETNSWIPQHGKTRIPAKGTKAMSTAPAAGG